ncbi:MAG: ABC transporter substrate-binding protein [Candidatus Hodarchaeales archaeon]
MRINRKITIYALFTILLFLGSSTAPIAGNILATPKYPDTLIIETIDKPETLDPGCSYETFGGALVDGIYESLITYGTEPKDLEGELASSWTVADDGESINFTIEPGHYFVFPENGSDTGVEVNAWVMKYSIDRTIIMADPDGYGWMLDMIIPGTDIQGGEGDTFSVANVNISDVLLYFAADGIEVLDDWTLRINLKFAYAAAVTIFAFNAGVAVNPYFVAKTRPTSYKEYSGSNGNDSDVMVDLADWFPTLAGNYTKLGFPEGWNSKISGVVPSTGVNSPEVHEEMTYSACGSGPFYLIPSETTYGQVINLARNTHWGEHTDQAFPEDIFDYIKIKTVNEVNTRLLDLKAGEGDLCGISATLYDEVIDMDEYFASGDIVPIIPDLIVQQITSLVVIFLGFNQKDLISESYVFESPDSAFNASDWKPYKWSNKTFSDDREVFNNPFAVYQFRQAFINSFDSDTFIKNVLNGFGIVPEGCIPVGLMGHQDQLIEDGYQPTYNPDTAKALFESIGWKGEIVLAYNEGNEVRRQAALLLESAIEGMDIGISIGIQEISWPTYLKIYKQLPAFLIGWAPDYADPDNYVSPFYDTYFAAQLNYTNPDVHQLILDAAAEPDQATRELMYKWIEYNATQDYPFLPLYQGAGLSIRPSWIQGEYQDVLNPMRNLNNPWERLEKTDYTPETTAATTTTTPTTTTTTTTTAGNETTTTTPATSEPTTSPGFELFALLGSIAVLVFVERKRRR